MKEDTFDERGIEDGILSLITINQSTARKKGKKFCERKDANEIYKREDKKGKERRNGKSKTWQETRGQREEGRGFLVRVIFRRSAPFSRGREAMKRGAARISAR